MVNELREVIKKRASLQPDDDFALEACLKEEARLLCEDISRTISFFRNECTGEELGWLSEVFDEVAVKTQSQELIDCLKEVSEKYPEETAAFRVRNNILSAEKAMRS